jgi:glycosyltransferase involved in cell wall biosynthesis
MKLGFLTENISDSSSTFIRRHADSFHDNINFICTYHKEIDMYNNIKVYSLLNDFSVSLKIKILKKIEFYLPDRYKIINDIICKKSLDFIITEHPVDCILIHFGWMSARVYKTLIKKKIPYVVIVHGEDMLSATKRLHHPYAKRLRNSINNSYITLFVSKFLFDKALVFKSSKEKMKLFYLGVPLHTIYASPDKQSEKIHICNIGRLVPIKGQIIIFEAVKILINKGYNLELIIFGEGPLRTKYDEWIQKNKFTDYIILKGSTPHEEVIKCLSISHIYVHSSVVLPDSTEEALGLAVIEAMSLGLPVVTSKTGGIIETVDEKTGIFVEPNNPQAMADAIEILIKNPELRKTMGQFGKEKIKCEFNILKQNEILKSYLNQAVSKSVEV